MVTILRKRTHAFLILEAIAALFVLTGAVFLMLTFHGSHVRGVRDLYARQAAQYLAESELERLTVTPYGDIPLGTDRPLKVDLPSTKQLNDLAVFLTVTQDAPNLKKASVRIEWAGRKGLRNTVRLERLLARKEADR